MFFIANRSYFNNRVKVDFFSADQSSHFVSHLYVTAERNVKEPYKRATEQCMY